MTTTTGEGCLQEGRRAEKFCEPCEETRVEVDWGCVELLFRGKLLGEGVHILSDGDERGSGV